jgi:hypothetical protein
MQNAIVDDNLRDALIAMITVGGGLLTAMVVTRITAQNSRRLERERWKRELYASLLHSTNDIRDAARLAMAGSGPQASWASAIDQGQRAMDEILILEPNMRPAVDRLWATALALTIAALDGVSEQEYATRDEKYRLEIAAFINEASKDLR